MPIDNAIRLGSSQAFSSSGATTDYWDSGKSRDIGSGESLAMVFTIMTAADYTTTDEAYSFAVQCDDNTSFSTPMTLASRLFSLANTNPPGTYLAAGKQVAIEIPPGMAERYIRGYLTLSGTTPSVTVSTDIMAWADIQKVPAHNASGFSIK